MKISLDELLRIDHVSTDGVEGIQKIPVTGVSTDSRSVKPGDAFVAIRGETFDGHNFVGDARSKGAVCAIVQQGYDGSEVALPLVVVKDTVLAYGQLARFHRDRFRIPVIGIAGSNGKTTTKEMIAAILGERYSVLSTEGNLNNHIGVPQTVLKLESRHDIAVIELGTNHDGELSYLCDIARPTHGLITNIGHEHLEFFRTIDGVMKAEGELFVALGSSGTAFVNMDDEMIRDAARRMKHKVTFGFTARAVAVKGRALDSDEFGRVRFTIAPRDKREFSVSLNIPGTHAMRNALAAAAVGLEFRVPARSIQKALSRVAAVSKRMEVVTTGGVTIVNDTYNANSDSVLAALEAFRRMKCDGRRVVILGDMLELGVESKRQHERVGDELTADAADCLLTYGTASEAICRRAQVPMKFHYDQKNVLCEYVAEYLLPGDLVLVKGSRGMKMEDVVTFLQIRLNQVHAHA